MSQGVAIFSLSCSQFSSTNPEKPLAFIHWVAGEARFNSDTVRIYQSGHSIISDGQGGIIAVWNTNVLGQGIQDIFAQRVDANGNLRWGASGVPVIAAADGYRFQPAMVPDGKGGAYIACSENFLAPYMKVLGQHFDATGKCLWEPGGKWISGTYTTRGPNVITDGSGGAIFAWVDFRNSSDNILGEIFGAQLDSGGTFAWGESGGLPLVTGVTVRPLRDPFDQVSMMPDGSSGAYFIWHDIRNTSGDLYAQRINASGEPLWGPTGKPTVAAYGVQASPSMVPAPGGGFLVSFSDTRPGAKDIFLQNVDPDGNSRWDTGGLWLNAKSGDQYYPFLVPLGNNRFFTMWNTAQYWYDSDMEGRVIDLCADTDGDGVTNCDGDCNDNDSAINPGATEHCDNLTDDNCNGTVNESCNYTITATAGSGGQILPNDRVSVAAGADQTFTIQANNNFKIANVFVDGTSIGAVSEYTFQNVLADHTINATFTGFSAVTVLAPNGGESIASGSIVTVKWGAPTTAVKFDLLYSLNNGSSWISIVKGLLNRYSYDWQPLPNVNSNQCKVKVVGYNASKKKVGEDVSDLNFTIEVIRVTTPNGGESFSRAATSSTKIKWISNKTSMLINKVSLFYATDGGTKWTKIKDLTYNPATYSIDQEYNWTLPSTNSSKYRVKVQLFNGGTSLGYDSSDANFTVGP